MAKRSHDSKKRSGPARVRATGSGTISFGIVSIPFKTYVGASSQRVRFTRMNDPDRTLRGFEFARDRFVTFDEDEIRALRTPSTDALELVALVPSSEVDLMCIDRTVYIGPERGGETAHRLFVRVLQRKQLVAVGRYATRGRSRLVVLRPYRDHGLVMQFVFHANEIRAFDEVWCGDDSIAFKPVEDELADRMFERLYRDRFDLSEYPDVDEERLRDAIVEKVARSVEPEPPKAEVIDLREVLRRRAKTAALIEHQFAPVRADNDT